MWCVSSFSASTKPDPKKGKWLPQKGRWTNSMEVSREKFMAHMWLRNTWKHYVFQMSWIRLDPWLTILLCANSVEELLWHVQRCIGTGGDFLGCFCWPILWQAVLTSLQLQNIICGSANICALIHCGVCKCHRFWGDNSFPSNRELEDTIAFRQDSQKFNQLTFHRTSPEH